ncbi:MAG: EMC3/TMCO1 family protein [Nanoarchaeota archaeon]
MKQKSLILIVMLIALSIGFLWDSVPWIKNSFHSILDPALGNLLTWNLFWGMTILIFIINLFMMLIQKYTTDQETLKQIRKDQKETQKEMKKYSNDPAKLMEMNKKQWEFMKDTLSLTMRSWIFTLIPLIILFRWFSDFFALINYKFLGIFSWFWFYVVCSIVLGLILKKILDVA